MLETKDLSKEQEIGIPDEIVVHLEVGNSRTYYCGQEATTNAISTGQNPPMFLRRCEDCETSCIAAGMPLPKKW